MANLGYFQLKAEPGVWTLGLREGPSREIFSLENYNNKPVVVHSFQSIVIKVKVKRNPGKETVSLLDSEEENSGNLNFLYDKLFKNRKICMRTVSDHLNYRKLVWIRCKET